MAELVIGLLLFIAAIEDLYHQKIFDGFAIGIMLVSLTTQHTGLANIVLSFVLLGLSFIPVKRPCWARGDGLLLAGLSFFYNYSIIVFILVLSTIVLFIFQIVFNLKSTSAIPLAPSLFLAWAAHFLNQL